MNLGPFIDHSHFMVMTERAVPAVRGAARTGRAAVAPGTTRPAIGRVEADRWMLPVRPPVRLVAQLAIVAAAVFGYFLVRGATEAKVGVAVDNARRVVDLERFLGLYHEPWLQSVFGGTSPVTTALNWIYIWGHWPVITVTLIWLARRHPVTYLRTRNAMLLSGGIGLVVFTLFPVAPPRLAGLGMVDTVTVGSHAYRVLQPTLFTNQYAAVPSLHVGWDLLMGLAITLSARSLWVRALGIAMPAAMTVAVVLTANHYILDAILGASLTTACWFAVGAWQRRQTRRRLAVAPVSPAVGTAIPAGPVPAGGHREPVGQYAHPVDQRGRGEHLEINIEDRQVYRERVE